MPMTRLRYQGHEVDVPAQTTWLCVAQTLTISDVRLLQRWFHQHEGLKIPFRLGDMPPRLRTLFAVSTADAERVVRFSDNTLGCTFIDMQRAELTPPGIRLEDITPGDRKD